MKTIIKTYLPLITLGIMAVGCNDIDPSERFIPMPKIESSRAVLLEDYTGQKCPNCPAGMRIIQDLQAQYSAQDLTLIPVSIHAGFFAIPCTQTNYEGLMMPFGDEMAAHRDITEYPSGAIDGEYPILYTNWSTSVYDAFNVEAYAEVTITDLKIEKETTYQSGVFNGEKLPVEGGFFGTFLTGRVTVLPINVAAESKFTWNLGVWALENDIVARQYNVNGDNRWDNTFTHNHVMRAFAGEDASQAYNDNVWGIPVALESYTPATFSFAIPLPNKFKSDKPITENLAAVAFLRNGGQYMQAAEAEVGEDNTTDDQSTEN